MRQANISTVTVVAWRRHGAGVALRVGVAVVSMSTSDKQPYVNSFPAQTGSDYHIDLTLPLP
jgi:hypothetical protein